MYLICQSVYIHMIWGIFYFWDDENIYEPHSLSFPSPPQSTSHVVIRTEESEGSTDIAIHKLTLEDSAVYTVTAENSAGKAQLSFNLRVVGELCTLWIKVPVQITSTYTPLLALFVTDILINIGAVPAVPG